ncbi:MAG: hypothetical protein BMS9Abin36_0500 [Gammaproteobacteria bacterium]|nr:MAG: hypothetical protein BMS9Abin36_0500 [Gammaproteobacteria bacterium]
MELMILRVRMLLVSVKHALLKFVGAMTAGVLVFMPTVAQAEWVEWITDVGLSVVNDSNLNRSAFSGDEAGATVDDEKSDQITVFNASLGRIYQIGTFTRASLTGDAEIRKHQDWDRLNSTMFGIGAGIRHKFGIGLARPWVKGAFTSRTIDVVSDLRDGSITTIDLSAGMRFTPWVDASIKYGQMRRDGQGGDSSGANVFDQERSTLAINANLTPLRNLTVSLGYSRSEGDFTSSCIADNAALVLSSEGDNVEAITLDDAFDDGSQPAFCAYRLGATTNITSLAISYGITRNFSANLGYEDVASKADVVDYEARIIRANVTARF